MWDGQLVNTESLIIPHWLPGLSCIQLHVIGTPRAWFGKRLPRLEHQFTLETSMMSKLMSPCEGWVRSSKRSHFIAGGSAWKVNSLSHFVDRFSHETISFQIARQNGTSRRPNQNHAASILSHIHDPHDLLM